MNYVISDIHNDDGRFCEMLARIHFWNRIIYLSLEMCLTALILVRILVYFHILELEDRCTILCGNHDQVWLHISDYYRLPEWKRRKNRHIHIIHSEFLRGD